MRSLSTLFLAASSAGAVSSGRTTVGVSARGDTSSVVQQDDDYTLFAEQTLKIVANAQKQKVLNQYRTECQSQENNLRGVSYNDFNDETLTCTLRCTGTQTFWNKNHNCVVRDKRKYASNETAWLWHFGQWQTDHCYIGPSDGQAWFEHQGCDISSLKSNKELCTGCYSGCDLPTHADVPIGVAFRHKSVFENAEKVSFRCKENYCWAAGIKQEELHGECFCQNGDCSWGICAGGACTQPDYNAYSILQEGCVDCSGGRCRRPVNARLCEDKVANIVPRSDRSCTADSVNPRLALFEDKKCQNDEGCNEYFMCAAFQTQAQSAISSQEETVNVKRCWQDGSDTVLAAVCRCYNKNECDFIEPGRDNDANSRRIFQNGCLVEFCQQDASYMRSVVARGR